MLRPLWSVNGSFASHTRRLVQNAKSSTRLLATQSSGDVNPPTASATLYLEDGTKLTGKSFGCHESVEGEVSSTKIVLIYITKQLILIGNMNVCFLHSTS